jgi:hypothetical protein
LGVVNVAPGALHTLFFFYVGDSRTAADNQLESEAWCRLDMLNHAYTVIVEGD